MQQKIENITIALSFIEKNLDIKVFGCNAKGMRGWILDYERRGDKEGRGGITYLEIQIFWSTIVEEGIGFGRAWVSFCVVAGVGFWWAQRGDHFGF